MNIVEAVKKEVNKITSKNEVILFGSRARGDNKKDSDWDFLILLDKAVLTPTEKEKIRDKLYELELESGEIISSLIHTKSEWEKRTVTPIYQIIQEEGLRA